MTNEYVYLKRYRIVIANYEGDIYVFNADPYKLTETVTSVCKSMKEESKSASYGIRRMISPHPFFYHLGMYLPMEEITRVLNASGYKS